MYEIDFYYHDGSSFSHFSQIRKGRARGQNYGNDCFSFSYLYFRRMLLKHKKCKFALTYYKQQEIYDSRVQILFFFKRCTFLKKKISSKFGFLSFCWGWGFSVSDTMQWAWLTCNPPPFNILVIMLSEIFLANTLVWRALENFWWKAFKNSRHVVLWLPFMLFLFKFLFDSVVF